MGILDEGQLCGLFVNLHVYFCQGVKAVIAESFDESHRRALVGVGVLPLQFAAGQTAHSLELTGREKFVIQLASCLAAQQKVTVVVSPAARVCDVVCNV